ncbi:hypothetical protein P7L75_11605 [Tistrella mobilis]|uniref:hypothetical protein n=1 Tax=Tistrella mobilis TaxID=171437 RepID=UPI003555FC26
MVANALDSDLRIRARVLQIMAALERAGATPISNRDLHSVAYLANVLSPIWDVEPLETSVLKDREGPRSIAFEHEIDLCIGQGLLVVASLRPDPENPTRLDATYRLNARVARPILDSITLLPDEQSVEHFLNELAFALAEIQPEARDDAALQDASWSNPAVAEGRIVDFGQHSQRAAVNPSYNAAQAFQRFAPEGMKFNRAEKLLMYMRLLKRRAHG